MRLKIIDDDFTISKLNNTDNLDLKKDFFFLTKTEDEISLVCKTTDVPSETLKREDNWKAFRIIGELDFQLIGILSPITKILADNSIGLFVVSTFNTDYILVKKDKFDKAIELLSNAGYRFV